MFVKPHYINVEKDKKIIVIDCFGISEEDIDLSSDYNNFQIIYGFVNVNPDDYSRIIAYVGSPDKKQMIKFTSLKWLQLSSAGVNGYDNPEIYKDYDNLVLSTCRGVYNTPISEYVVGMMFLMSKSSIYNNLGFRKKLMAKNDIELNEATVLLVGFGNIGKLIAKKCRALGVKKIIAVKKDTDFQSPLADEVVSLDMLEMAITDVDFVISSLPENEKTKGIFNYRLFSKMKSSAIFINVGRESAVVEKDLISALKHSVISGAVLDPSSDRLVNYKKNRLLVTGHTSFFSNENKKRAVSLINSRMNCFLKNDLDGIQKINK